MVIYFTETPVRKLDANFYLMSVFGQSRQLFITPSGDNLCKRLNNNGGFHFVVKGKKRRDRTVVFYCH